MTGQEIFTEAAEYIVNKMHKGMPFSIKTIDGWIQAKYSRLGSRGTTIATRAAIKIAVEQGLIARRDGKYAPGVTEGYVLA